MHSILMVEYVNDVQNVRSEIRLLGPMTILRSSRAFTLRLWKTTPIPQTANRRASVDSPARSCAGKILCIAIVPEG